MTEHPCAEAGLGFVWREGPRGSYLFRERRYSLDAAYGSALLGHLAQSGLSGLEQVASERGVRGVRAEDLLFFDTETTGLGTGAGNLIFLFGAGYFREDSFVVEHYFLPDVAGEPALLADFLQTAGRFPVMVTYNGKGFDWPQLRTRLVLNRLRLEKEPFHCDLLYPARRLWKGRLPSCRLQEVEASCLGLSRKGDVPGQLAPALYFEYLQSQNLTGLDGVFRHNEQDVLSLSLILGHILRTVGGGTALTHPEDRLAVGRWWQRHGEDDRAYGWFHSLAAEEELPLAVRREAYREAARCLKRRGKWLEAVRFWTRWMEEDSWNPEPCIELAKYREHRTRETRMALELTMEAIGRLTKRKRLGGFDAGGKELEALRHRAGRLAVKKESRLF